MAKPADIARLGGVPVDPDLILIALELAGERLGRRGNEADAVTLAADAYAEYAGVDDDDPLDEADAIDAAGVIGALACRLVALAELVEANRIAPGTYPPEAVADAASTARLMSVKGAPAFQLLEFLAQVERAAKASRPW